MVQGGVNLNQTQSLNLKRDSPVFRAQKTPYLKETEGWKFK
jgi:hypothetical protein